MCRGLIAGQVGVMAWLLFCTIARRGGDGLDAEEVVGRIIFGCGLEEST